MVKEATATPAREWRSVGSAVRLPLRVMISLMIGLPCWFGVSVGDAAPPQCAVAGSRRDGGGSGSSERGGNAKRPSAARLVPPARTGPGSSALAPPRCADLWASPAGPEASGGRRGAESLSPTATSDQTPGHQPP